MIHLFIGADDRTGALEAAGACADAGSGPVRVVAALGAAAGGGVVVVDLATRHLERGDASGRAAALETAAGGAASAHKIDSTLRGNWADEVVARHRAAGRRILVVPALPAVGRTCSGGTVFEHGRPVGDGPAGGDPRTPVRSSRPADHLRHAGAAGVVELADADEVAAWLATSDGSPFAVCDAATDADLAAVAARWAGRPDVVVAGTAAAIGAAVGAMLGSRGRPPRPSTLPSPVLVVTGSLHPAARRQVAHLGSGDGVVVELGEALEAAVCALRAGVPVALTSRVPPTAAPVGEADARRTAQALAAAARSITAAVVVGTLVVLGGDTAAEVLGPEPIMVGGTVAPGTPWGRRADGAGPLLVTRAGGFGDADALAALLSGRLER